MWNCGVLLLCVFVMVPQETCPDNETCASKCCPKGEGWDFLEDRCRALSREFSPPTKRNYSEEKKLNVSKEFHYLEGIIGCSRNKKGKKEYKRLVSELKRDFHLLPNGSLFMESDRAAGPGMIFDINKYCIDLFITAENKTKWDAIICHIPRPFKRHRDLTLACIVITCVLVLLRVVAFACLPELRTLHGKILLAYLISFFMALLLMASKMFLTNGNKINREACSVLSFIVYFVTLLAFFWRNVMCYDIWWTFSGKRAKSGRGSSSRTRFCLYCAYAFGWPTALTALMVALEFSGLSDEHVLMPKVWHYGCKGLDGYARLIYYYGPILTLFVINMVLFALTALKIAGIKKETRTVLKSKESATHDRKNDVERFSLYANLFASMLFLEVNWILDSVTIFYPDARNVSIITDFCNLAVLLFIFVNFVCKKRTWIMIKKRYQHMTGRSSGITTVTSINRTLTSQTSQISLSQDTEQWNPAVSQNKTPDIMREKSSLFETQEDNITNEYSRDSQNPAVSQDDIQSLDSIQNNSSPAESQGVTKAPDFIREKSSPVGRQDNTQSLNISQEKSSPAESQEYTQSLDFIREKSSPVEIQDNTQSPDFIREKSNPVEIQDNTQSPDFIRENSSHAESLECSQSLDFTGEKSSPVEIQDNTQPPDFIREKSSHAESLECTQSLDFIGEKSNPVEIPDNTQSPDFIREKSSHAESLECSQSFDFIGEKSNPVDIPDNTQSPDFIREKSSHAVSIEYSQSFDFIGEKSNPVDIPDNTQSPEFIRENSSHAESLECSQSLDFTGEKSSPVEIQDNTQPPDFIREKSNHAESLECTQSLDFIGEKSKPVEIPDNTQSPDFIREKSSHAESLECSQSFDFIGEKSNPVDIPDNTQSPDFIREKSSHAVSIECSQSFDFIGEKSNPVDIPDNTQSPDFIREKPSRAKSLECTQSLDFIGEKSSPVEIQDNTQSPDFIREKSSHAESLECTQSLDYIREKSSPNFSGHKTFLNEEPDDNQAPEIIVKKTNHDGQECTVSTDFIREKSNPTNTRRDTQSPNCSPKKTVPTTKQSS